MGWTTAANLMRDWSRRRRRKAVVREVSPAFTGALAKYFGDGPTDVAASRAAHQSYVAALETHGLEVTILPASAAHPDCCFVEDVAVVVDGAAVICTLGHPSRRGEEEGVREVLGAHLELIEMPDGATLDGGDVVFYDGTYLVGLSERTNRAGVDFFTSVCAKRGFETFLFEVPPTTLHLSTICSTPAPGLLVAAEGHLTPEQFNGLRGDVVWVPNEESYAANTIGFEGGRVIISAGYPQTKRILEERGFKTNEVEMEHIRAADGSLTCLRLFIS